MVKTHYPRGPSAEGVGSVGFRSEGHLDSEGQVRQRNHDLVNVILRYSEFKPRSRSQTAS